MCLLMTSVSVCASLTRPAGCLSQGHGSARGLARPAFLLSTLRPRLGYSGPSRGGEALMEWEQALARDYGWNTKGRSVRLTNPKAWETTGI